MTRPNFLGIGAIKAGTTWVADALAAHPDLFMAHGKELHYFSRQFERGEAWYLKHFAAARGRRAVGEYSVTYMDGSPQTARRVHDFDPAMRLIVAVRDPVARAFSQYRWEKQMGRELPPFRESMAMHPFLADNSRYAANLAPYWERFPDEQFFYVRQVDIRTRPEAVCRELYAFLGLDPDFTPPAPERVVGETIQPRSRALEDLRIRLHHAAMEFGAGYLITLYRRLGLSRLYRRINNDPEAVEQLTDRDRQELAPLFDEDLARFREHTGISVVD